MRFWKISSKRAGSRMTEDLYAEDILELWSRHERVFDHFSKTWLLEIEEIATDGCVQPRGPEEVRSAWNMETIRFEDDETMAVNRAYIGSVMALAPSGKFWTFWACGNMRMKEMAWDTIFWDLVDTVLDKYGMWRESGEGDPTDVFFCAPLDYVDASRLWLEMIVRARDLSEIKDVLYDAGFRVG